MANIGVIRKGHEIGSANHWAKFVWLACEICGKERWVQMLRGEPQFKLCVACANRTPEKRAACHIHWSVLQGGALNQNWKGGRTRTSGGYILVYIGPNDFFSPMAVKKRYVLEHRLVVAKRLGRCLHLWEIVHHKNGVRDDNREENLQLVQEMQHSQIRIMEKKIKHLEKRLILVEAENIVLREVAK